MNRIRAKLDSSIPLPSIDSTEDDVAFTPYEDEDETMSRTVLENELVDAIGQPVMQQSFNDKKIHTEVLLPRVEMEQVSKVIIRYVDKNGKLISAYHDNPILNTLIYECEIPDETVKPYGANMIAQIIHDSVNVDGYSESFIVDILDFAFDSNPVDKKDSTW
eukprot:CAMPEP_0197843090 /NCGR_PEP_ID=MMETSP1437-20131217/47115_1 /TAXON_ID=49252 ORGANISM="Eucampia antarctica, Strain CCMP1452" /NCGR_SAMPLE_ID=MMETSP1437 /ASSEMBLY_ACC=CAM_ASM_001096 /LENGTH=161 /DNA_ID=CAMNT_0043453073 /DNA_START=1740 /DNA_END=2222 /DNA_ORIENTATION=+